MLDHYFWRFKRANCVVCFRPRAYVYFPVRQENGDSRWKGYIYVAESGRLSC